MPNAQMNHCSRVCPSGEKKPTLACNSQGKLRLLHLNNGVYMGGTSGRGQRQGQGILLLDSGACILATYLHDRMTGHNVIFKDGCLMSVLVISEEQKCVCYRSGPEFLSVVLDARDRPAGTGFYANYKDRELYRISYQEGFACRKFLVRNQETCSAVLGRGDLRPIVEHECQAEVFNNSFSNLADFIGCRIKGSQLTFGILKKAGAQHLEQFDGLKFVVNVNNSDLGQFDVRLLERGNFQDEKMEGFGQRQFSNGDYYMGGFRQGEFEGLGVLVYPSARKYTYGLFMQGQMAQQIESSSPLSGGVQSDAATTNKHYRERLNENFLQIHSQHHNYTNKSIVQSPLESSLRRMIRQILDIQFHQAEKPSPEGTHLQLAPCLKQAIHEGSSFHKSQTELVAANNEKKQNELSLTPKPEQKKRERSLDSLKTFNSKERMLTNSSHQIDRYLSLRHAVRSYLSPSKQQGIKQRCKKRCLQQHQAKFYMGLAQIQKNKLHSKISPSRSPNNPKHGTNREQEHPFSGVPQFYRAPGNKGCSPVKQAKDRNRHLKADESQKQRRGA